MFGQGLVLGKVRIRVRAMTRGRVMIRTKVSARGRLSFRARVGLELDCALGFG